jgi:hypothetical protein
MPTIPTPTEHIDDDIEREMLSDPEVKKALAELEYPEDRGDLIDALIVLKGIAEGKIKTHTLEEVKKELGL